MKLTPELKAQFFPLLDDMGGMEEIYTVEELRQRILLHRQGSNGAKMWCKGVSTVRDDFYGRKEFRYYDCVVAYFDHKGNQIWNY